jgi:hypothetical protein
LADVVVDVRFEVVRLRRRDVEGEYQRATPDCFVARQVVGERERVVAGPAASYVVWPVVLDVMDEGHIRLQLGVDCRQLAFQPQVAPVHLVVGKIEKPLFETVFFRQSEQVAFGLFFPSDGGQPSAIVAHHRDDHDAVLRPGSLDQDASGADFRVIHVRADG